MVPRSREGSATEGRARCEYAQCTYTGGGYRVAGDVVETRRPRADGAY